MLGGKKKKKARDNDMVLVKIQWTQPARKCKYPHSEQ